MLDQEETLCDECQSIDIEVIFDRLLPGSTPPQGAPKNDEWNQLENSEGFFIADLGDRCGTTWESNKSCLLCNYCLTLAQEDPDGPSPPKQFYLRAKSCRKWLHLAAPTEPGSTLRGSEIWGRCREICLIG